MSDEEAEQGVESERIKQLIKDTREQAKQNASDREAIQAERLAVGMDRANIPESGPGLLFRENYKGDPSAEAIRSEAEKYGILGSTGAQQQQADTSQEDELQRIRSSQGIVGDGGQVPNREDEIRAQMIRIADDPTMQPFEKDAAIMAIARANKFDVMDTSEKGSERFLARG